MWRLVLGNDLGFQECLKIPMFGCKLHQGIRCQGNLNSPFKPLLVGMWISLKIGEYLDSQA